MHDRQTPSKREAQGSEVSNSTGEMTCHSMVDDRLLQFETAREGSILSPGRIRELEIEDDQLLFDQVLPDSTSNTGPQGEEPFALDFSHPNANGTMNESMTPLSNVSTHS